MNGKILVNVKNHFNKKISNFWGNRIFELFLKLFLSIILSHKSDFFGISKIICHIKRIMLMTTYKHFCTLWLWCFSLAFLFEKKWLLFSWFGLWYSCPELWLQTLDFQNSILINCRHCINRSVCSYFIKYWFHNKDICC